MTPDILARALEGTDDARQGERLLALAALAYLAPPKAPVLLRSFIHSPRRASSRHQAEIHLESHVHGKHPCVVWGRADEKGLSTQYLVSRLFHSATPIWNDILIQVKEICWIILTLQRGEPGIGSWWIDLVDTLLSLV